MQIISEIAEIIAVQPTEVWYCTFSFSILGKRIRYDGGNM